MVLELKMLTLREYDALEKINCFKVTGLTITEGSYLRFHVLDKEFIKR